MPALEVKPFPVDTASLRTPSVETYSLTDKLIFAAQGRKHFDQALDLAVTIQYGNAANDLIYIAEKMNNAGVLLLEPVLDRLIEVRDRETDQRFINAMERGRSVVYAMIGAYDKALALNVSAEEDTTLNGISTLIQIIETAYKLGQPTEPHIENAFSHIATARKNGAYQGNTVIAYKDLAQSLHNLSVNDSLRAFDLAEATLDEVERGNNDWSGREAQILAEKYAACGFFDRALAVIDKIPTDDDPDGRALEHYRGAILANVAHERLSQGHLEEAIQTARTTGSIWFVAEVLAEAASISSEADANDAMTYEYVYEAELLFNAVDKPPTEPMFKAYPKIGLAYANLGEDEKAFEFFKEVWDQLSMLPVDNLDKSNLLNLAVAVDDAGFDASSLYREAFTWNEAIAKELKDSGLNYDIGPGIIDAVLKRGHIQLAQEIVPQYVGDGTYGTRQLANLAAAETKLGLKEVVAAMLSAAQVREVLKSGSSEAKAALEYFGHVV